MFRKGAAVIAFGVGAWFGYQYALDIIEHFGLDLEDYWGSIGGQALRVIIPIALGTAAGVGTYFLLNLFARAD